MRPFRFFFGTALTLILFVFFAKFLVMAFILAFVFKIVHSIFYRKEYDYAYNRNDRDYYEDDYSREDERREGHGNFFRWNEFKSDPNFRFWKEEREYDYDYDERIIEVK